MAARTEISSNSHTENAVYVFFQGQGSDLSSLAKEPFFSKEVVDTARKVFGLDVTRFTESQLRRTEFSQLALIARGLDGLEKLKSSRPDLFDPKNVVIFAGFSLGEITALAAAGRLSMEDAFKVVKVRAKAMQKACDASKGQMITLLGVEDDSKIPCCISSKLFPQCRVVAGDEKELARISWVPAIAAKAIPRTELNGAFHTPAMINAAEAIRSIANSVQQCRPTKNRFAYSNLTGGLYQDDENVIESLAKQVVSTVEWEQTLTAALTDPRQVTYVEIGSGSQIKTMLSKIPCSDRHRASAEAILAF